MDITKYEYPFDNVDWRWTRVCNLDSENKLPDPDDDKYIHRGYKFLRELNRVTSGTEAFAVSRRHPYVGRAFGWWTNSGMRKYYIEALLLCKDITTQDIASYMGAHPAEITLYSKLFFDVRHQLNNTGFICSRILEPAIIMALVEYKDPNIMWKLAAIFGGFKVVKAYWELGPVHESVDAFNKASGISAMLRNFAASQHLTTVNKYNTSEIAAHVMAFTAQELQNKGAGRGLPEDRREFLSALASTMQFYMPDITEPQPAKVLRLYERIQEPASGETTCQTSN